MASEARPFDVAVIGAGIPGCAAALGAAQSGMHVALIGPAPALFEASDEAPVDPRIYALSPATVAFLERLRVWEPAGRPRQDIVRMIVSGDAGGRLTFDAWQQAVGRLAVIVEENDLMRAFATACRFASLARYEARLDRLTDRLMDRLTASSGALTEITLTDGQRLAARLVVGADGARSAVRAAAGIHAEEHAYDQTAVVANFALQRPHHGFAWQWFDAEGVIALLPLPGERVSLVWSAPTTIAQGLLAADPETLARRVEAHVAPEIGALRLLGRPASFPLQRLQVDALVGSRVALVGDAAHVIHPLAGQGLNLGLQDVSELLRVLVRARELGDDPGEARTLRAYARARAEPVRAMRTVTDGLARLFGVDRGPVRELRNFGMNLVDQVAPLKHFLVQRALG